MNKKYGTRVKQMDAVHKVMPFILNKRCDAEVYMSEKVDVTNLLKYLEKKNKGVTKEEKMTLFHALVTAMGKIVYERPLLNRYIQGKRYYDRNEVSLSFIAKTKFSNDAEEMIIKLIVKEDDNIDTIKDDILKKVTKVRKENTNDIDKVINILTGGPHFLTNIVIGTVKWLDKHGWLPRFITDGDYNYSTVLFTNLGSIKCNQIYHHLNNYGTNSIFLAIGTLHKEEILINNKKEIRDIVDIGITCDERIADGFYFAKAILLFKHIIENPIVLEKAMKERVEYEDK